MTEYTHLELEQNIPCFGGYYVPMKEGRLNLGDREVLYVAGQAVIEASCCGVGSWGYIMVPGYIVRWQNRKDDSGQPVSEVEPISDEATKAKIRELLKDTEPAARISTQIDFW